MATFSGCFKDGERPMEGIQNHRSGRKLVERANQPRSSWTALKAFKRGGGSTAHSRIECIENSTWDKGRTLVKYNDVERSLTLNSVSYIDG